jgi:hypothetical protein
MPIGQVRERLADLAERADVPPDRVSMPPGQQ